MLKSKLQTKSYHLCEFLHLNKRQQHIDVILVSRSIVSEDVSNEHNIDIKYETFILTNTKFLQQSMLNGELPLISWHLKSMSNRLACCLVAS